MLHFVKRYYNSTLNLKTRILLAKWVREPERKFELSSLGHICFVAWTLQCARPCRTLGCPFDQHRAAWPRCFLVEPKEHCISHGQEKISDTSDEDGLCWRLFMKLLAQA
eukprot:4670509-Amphidinium_carterae.1